MTAPILIVGAGPTGLNLALSLARRGVPFRIISDANGPGEHSRAMVVQARTLEFYGQFGFADEVIAQGVIADRAHVRECGGHQGAHEVNAFRFRELGKGISPYPFALAYPQDDHERFLIGKLKDAGHAVEWKSKLVSFAENGIGIQASISRNGQTEDAQAEYICGCDGAHNRVRETLKIGFPGRLRDSDHRRNAGHARGYWQPDSPSKPKDCARSRSSGMTR